MNLFAPHPRMTRISSEDVARRRLETGPATRKELLAALEKFGYTEYPGKLYTFADYDRRTKRFTLKG